MRATWMGWSMAVLVASAAAGCSAIRFESEPEPAAAPAPDPRPVASLAGSWAGMWEIEGQRIQGTLVLRQNGADLQATFASPALGGDAAGAGNLDADGQVELELSYNVACPGTARLTGEVLDRAGRLSGTLVATDCTGRANGTFAFSRR